MNLLCRLWFVGCLWVDFGVLCVIWLWIVLVVVVAFAFDFGVVMVITG